MRKVSAMFLAVVVSSGLASNCFATHTKDSSDVATARVELTLPRILHWLLAAVPNHPDQGCVPSEVDDCGIQDPQ